MKKPIKKAAPRKRRQRKNDNLVTIDIGVLDIVLDRLHVGRQNTIALASKLAGENDPCVNEVSALLVLSQQMREDMHQINAAIAGAADRADLPW